MANFTLDSTHNKQPGTANADVIDGLDGNDTLLGLDNDDVLSGGNGLDSLDGGVGADTLSGGTGGDVLLGGSDDDVLLGEDGNDTLDGGNGADTLDGGSGGDRLSGGDGNDTFFIDNLADVLLEAARESGEDVVYSRITYRLPEQIENLNLQGSEAINGLGNMLANRLTGNDAANRLEGGDGFDTLIGGAGADTLDGGIGVDNLMGGDGDDLYIVSSTEDKISETEGGGDQDEIRSSVDFSLIDYLENLTLTGLAPLRGIGNRLANRLTGNAGHNDLSGEAGDDTLAGGEGNDTLTGGQGNDRFDGGLGDDTVMYSGVQSGYSVTADGDNATWRVIDTNPRDGNDGEDILTGIEQIAFADAVKSPADFIRALPSLSIASLSRAEGSGKTNTLFKFPVTLSAPAASRITVDYSLQAGTALVGEDFLNKKGSLVFNPGQTRQFVQVGVKADSLAEADERFTVQLLKPAGAMLLQASATGTIQNDDGDKPGLPQISLQSVSVNEGQAGAGFATVNLSLSKASHQIVTVHYATQDGTATAGEDYIALSNVISFAPGVTTASIKIPVRGDTVVEASETVQVQLGSPVNAELDAATATATLTLTNDDQPEIRLQDLSLVEADTEAAVQVSLSMPSPVAVTVNYQTSDATARAGSDYRLTQGSLTFAPGETQKTIAVGIMGDSQVEPDETFSLTLDSPVNGLLAATRTATVTLNNDDLPSLSLSGLTVPEGDSGTGSASVEVKLSAPISQTVTVRYTTRDGTAVAHSDYTPLSGTLTFAPGETGQTITLPILSDSAAEPDETFSLELGDPVNASLAAATSAVIAIRNDDLPVITMAPLSTIEGNDPARYLTTAVSLSAASQQIITVNYVLADGSATAGSDYLPDSGIITFSPGQTEQTLGILVLGDQQAEADEAFTLHLSDPVNARLDSPEPVTVTLQDDDTVPTVSLNGVTLPEGNSGQSTATVTVSLSGIYSETVTLDYATQDGTAEAGSDYTATSGRLTFAPGETSQTIPVQVLGDTTVEEDETFKVFLSKVANALLNPEAASDTIRLGNDDAYRRTANGQEVKPVIDLGKNYGKLIRPVTVDGGHWFYYWDVSGDGTKAGNDSVTHDWLDKLFRQNVNGRTGGDGNTDNTYRYATLNGVKLALPTVGNGDDFMDSLGYRKGTAVQGKANNPTYDDYLAIWDAYNGTGTGRDIDGTPPGWGGTFYWSATPAASGHAGIGLYGGYVGYGSDGSDTYVAVEVL